MVVIFSDVKFADPDYAILEPNRKWIGWSVLRHGHWKLFHEGFSGTVVGGRSVVIGFVGRTKHANVIANLKKRNVFYGGCDYSSVSTTHCLIFLNR